jgi:hypothetical protein
MRRWADNGVWVRVLEDLQTKLNMSLDVTALLIDSTNIKAHPDGTGALNYCLVGVPTKTAYKPSAKVRWSQHKNSPDRRERNHTNCVSNFNRPTIRKGEY